MSGRSSRGKGFGSGRGKGGRRELPLCGRGLLGLISLRNQCISFPPRARVISLKSALRGYDNRKEDWPKCMHGEDCLVQMFTKGIDGGRRFFKCPRAWVIAITFRLLNMFLEYPYNTHDILIVVF